MTTKRIYFSARRRTGLTDVKVSIYNDASTVIINEAIMTELSSSGVYYYDFTTSTTDAYVALMNVASLGLESPPFEFSIGLAVGTYTPTSSVTYSDIRDDVGKAWNMIDGTTSAIVSRLIGRAEEDVKDITGTTAGFKRPIRYMTDAYVIDHGLAGGQPQALGKDRLISMRDKFYELADVALLRKGYNFKNIRPKLYVSN
jgi:hypothetical protein